MNKLYKKLKLMGLDHYEFLLAVTHRSVLKEEELESRNQIEYYLALGNRVYEYIVVRFMIENYSSNMKNIKLAVTKSISKSIILLFNRMDLERETISRHEIDKNKISPDIVYQFFGLVYDKFGINEAYEIFCEYYKTEDIIIDYDYLSIVNEHLRGALLNFTELDRSGPHHETEFTFKLDVNNESFIAKGNSIKSAKQNCAEEYCRKKLTNKIINEIAGKKETLKSENSPFKIDELRKPEILKTCKKWSFKKEDLTAALINKILYTRFDVLNCNHLLTLGSLAEQIVIFKFVHHEYSYKSNKFKIYAKSILAGHTDVFFGIINMMNINDMIFMKEFLLKSVNEEHLFKETSRILISFAFESNNKIFFENYYILLKKILDSQKLHLECASTSMNEIIDMFIFTRPNIEVVRINSNDLNPEFEAKLSLMVKNQVYKSRSVGSTKSEATEKVNRILWSKIYTFIVNSFEKNIKIDLKEVSLYCYILERLTNNLEGFMYLAREFELPIFELIKKNDIQKFIIALHNFSRNLHYFDQEVLMNDITSQLRKNPEKLIIGENPILILAIWEYVIEYINQEKIDTTEGVIVSLKNKTNMILASLLENNGNLINTISNQTEDLQEIAVLQNPHAIAYISKPTEKATKIAYEKDPLIIEKNPENIEQLIHIKADEISEYLDVYNNTNQNYFLLDQFCFDIYLKAIISRFQIRKFYVACGFVYASGVKLLSKEMEILLGLDADLRIIAGNLQNYYKDKVQKSMDLETAISLNDMIKKGLKLKTIQQNFYHGKIYFLETEDLIFVLNGSTNFSRNAFRNNDEIDNLIIYRNSKNGHTSHFLKLWEKGIPIDMLDVTKFRDNLLNDLENDALIKIDEETMKSKVLSVNDQALKERLLLWLTYRPSEIYDKIDVAEREYIAIEYLDRDIVVLESFFPSNAYFVFYNLPIRDLLKKIQGKKKREIFELSKMEKRGYHLKEKLKLEVKIKSYFI